MHLRSILKFLPAVRVPWALANAATFFLIPIVYLRRMLKTGVIILRGALLVELERGWWRMTETVPAFEFKGDGWWVSSSVCMKRILEERMFVGFGGAV